MSASVAASEPALRNIAERGAFSSLSVIAQPDRVSSLYFSHDPDDSVRPLKSPAIWYADVPRSASFVSVLPNDEKLSVEQRVDDILTNRRAVVGYDERKFGRSRATQLAAAVKIGFQPLERFCAVLNDRVQLRAFDKRQIQHLIRRTLDEFEIGDVELCPVPDPRGALNAPRNRFRTVFFDFRLDEAIAIHSVIEF